MFKSDKYTLKAAMAWSMLHGYVVRRNSPGSGVIQLHVNDPSIFAAGKFKTVVISKEIKALIGGRKDRSTRSGRPPSQIKMRR